MSSQTCCICIPIRTGVLIIAGLGMVGGFFNIARVIVGLTQLPHSGSSEESAAITSSVISIIWGVVNILISVMLWKGVTEQKPSFCRRWVLVNVISMALGSIFNVGIIIWLAIASGMGIVPAIYILLIYALAISWAAYYVWVVQKYAKLLEGELYGVPTSIQGE